MTNRSSIFFCNCGGGIFASEKLAGLQHELNKLDADVYELKDLCALSLNEKAKLEDTFHRYEKNIIIACYPRAIKHLFIQNKVSATNYEVINFRLKSVADVINELTGKYSIEKGQAIFESLTSELDVPAWYPVIDQTRCTLCGKCAKFCLFGVYQFDKKSLKVVNPLSCKNNCPACGRTCPSSAFMFPRLPEDSILSGDVPAFKMAVDIAGDSLLGALNKRNSNRRSIFNAGAIEKAEEERKQALDELKKEKKE